MGKYSKARFCISTWATVTTKGNKVLPLRHGDNEVVM